MEPAGLIFDCDGTLADTMPLHYEAWDATLRRFHLSLDEDRFYALGGWPSRSVAELLIVESHLTVDPSHVAEQKEALFLTMLDRVTPIEPIVAEARKHRGRLPMAVATGATSDICERILYTIGIRDWFGALVAADHVERHKPEPDVFLEAARQIGVEPARCIVYEDADPGIEAARRAGMEFVDVRRIYTPRRVTPRNPA
jgi:beta-phosphoglucomutase family hydrolase